MQYIVGELLVKAVKLLSLGVVVTGFVLSGCAEEQSGAVAASESLSRQLQPQDATIAGIYDRSCRNCHTIAATGAPLTGDAKGWSVRLDKGMDTLVDNVVAGFGGMPPLGMCMDCEFEDFEALIVFMAQAWVTGSTASD